jgi:hypothetical protein
VGSWCRFDRLSWALWGRWSDDVRFPLGILDFAVSGDVWTGLESSLEFLNCTVYGGGLTAFDSGLGFFDNTRLLLVLNQLSTDESALWIYLC